MSHWISVAQPPLRDLPSGIRYGSGVLDDPLDFAQKQLYSGVKSALTFGLQKLVGHPGLKAVIATGTGPLIDIAVGHFPEQEKVETKKRKARRKIIEQMIRE